MIISGYTDDRLSEVRTYNKLQPYIVGVNGVTYAEYPPNKINVKRVKLNGSMVSTPYCSRVDYVLNDITYITKIKLSPGDEYVFNNTQTTYFFNSSGLTQQEINVIKEEVEMSISERPKIESEIFIDRQTSSVYERHMRMEEITSLEQLEGYRNGFYSIIKN